MILLTDEIRSPGHAPTHETIESEREQQLDALQEILRLLKAPEGLKTGAVTGDAVERHSWARGVGEPASRRARR